MICVESFSNQNRAPAMHDGDDGPDSARSTTAWQAFGLAYETVVGHTCACAAPSLQSSLPRDALWQAMLPVARREAGLLRLKTLDSFRSAEFVERSDAALHKCQLSTIAVALTACLVASVRFDLYCNTRHIMTVFWSCKRNDCSWLEPRKRVQTPWWNTMCTSRNQQVESFNIFFELAVTGNWDGTPLYMVYRKNTDNLVFELHIWRNVYVGLQFNTDFSTLAHAALRNVCMRTLVLRLKLMW